MPRLIAAVLILAALGACKEQSSGRGYFPPPPIFDFDPWCLEEVRPGILGPCR